jgi:HSP20 family protein
MVDMTRYIVQRPTRAASLDRFFNDLWNTFPAEPENSAVAPPIDVIERDDTVEVQVNLPGVNPDDVSIEFEDGVLTIATHFENEANEEGPNYTRRERFHGAYERSLRVPDSLDTQNAAANFENGVLTLTLPKKPEAQPLRIPVNVSKN